MFEGCAESCRMVPQIRQRSLHNIVHAYERSCRHRVGMGYRTFAHFTECVTMMHLELQALADGKQPMAATSHVETDLVKALRGLAGVSAGGGESVLSQILALLKDELLGSRSQALPASSQLSPIAAAGVQSPHISAPTIGDEEEGVGGQEESAIRHMRLLFVLICATSVFGAHTRNACSCVRTYA